MSPKSLVENRISEIRHNTHRKYSAEEKVRIVIEGLRGEDSIAVLCRKEGLNQNLYTTVGVKIFLKQVRNA